jgi:hypothetical protein
MGLVAEHFCESVREQRSGSVSVHRRSHTHKLLGSAHQAGVASAQGLAIYWDKSESPDHIMYNRRSRLRVHVDRVAEWWCSLTSVFCLLCICHGAHARPCLRRVGVRRRRRPFGWS